MIVFVLNATREHSRAFQRVRVPASIAKLHARVFPPHDFAANSRERKATLAADKIFAVEQLNFRVGKSHRHREFRGNGLAVENQLKILRLAFRRTQIDDEKMHRTPDLRCGKPDAVCIVHRLDHIFRELFERLAEIRHFRAFGAKHGIAVIR